MYVAPITIPVILKLGKIGDQVEVKNGFGRNYLIPKGMAILATESVKKMNSEISNKIVNIDEKITNAEDIVQKNIDQPMVSVKTEELVSHAIERMRAFNISQMPVEDSNGFVGSVDETVLLRNYFTDKKINTKPIKEVMGHPFPIVKKSASIDTISKLITKDTQAVLVDLENGKHHIITKSDIINAI